MSAKNYLLTGFLLVSLLAFGQRQGEIWHFGEGFAISLESGDPVILTQTSIDATEGCVSYCDENGQLLFYSNGGGRPPLVMQSEGSIWNREHNLMYNMMGEQGGGFSSAQSSLVVPVPGQTDQYYLFTMEETEFEIGGGFIDQPQGRGLSYFIIDMTLNGGLGGVVGDSDTRVFTPSFEGLSGTIHNNQEDYWIVSYEAVPNAAPSRFVVHPVTAAGVGDPIFSDISTETPLNGSIKMSPDGRWIESNGFLFGFDNSTGEVSQFLFEPVSVGGVFASSFTADSRYLYLRSIDINGQRGIFRVELVPGYPEELITTVPFNSINTTAMQLAPNGDIYYTEVVLSQPYYLNRIRCPSAPVPIADMHLLELSNSTNPLTIAHQLPNFTDHLFAQESQGDTTNLEETVVQICGEVDTTLQSPISGEIYSWSTGEDTPEIMINMAGNYAVTVVDGCGDVTIAPFLVESSEELPELTLQVIVADGGPFCEDNPTIIGAVEVNGGIFDDATFLWSNDSTDSALLIEEEGLYSVTVTRGACAAEAEASFLYETEECNSVCNFDIPNVFTPNGDGVNDSFGIFSNCGNEDYLAYNLVVYSRWGELIYESTTPDQRWDGIYEGEAVPSDVYIYRLQFQFEDAMPEEREGQITLLR